MPTDLDTPNRAVFNGMSNVFPCRFGLVCLVLWLVQKKLKPLSQLIKCKTKNQLSIEFSSARSSLFCFTFFVVFFPSHRLLVTSNFTLIGCCNSFGFDLKTLNRKVLYYSGGDQVLTELLEKFYLHRTLWLAKKLSQAFQAIRYRPKPTVT